MAKDDFERLEQAEFAAYVDLYRAAPAALRREHAIEVVPLSAATCLGCRDFDPPAIFRRPVGLGVGRAVSEAELEAVLAHMDARGLRYAVPVAEQTRPSELSAWLAQRGFTRGYAWMRFRRDCSTSRAALTNLQLRVAGTELGADFGRVVAEGFGLPAAIAPWLAALPGRASWICLLAFDGASPVAAGAAYLDGDHAWLGFGATLASHRRRGAQSALLARRIEEAAARGARVAVTETGERLPDRPSHSYRNLLRAGFQERYLRQNWLSPAG